MFGNAYALVYHADAGQLAPARQPHRDLAARRRVFDGIVQHIDHRAQQHVVMAVHPQRLRRVQTMHGDALLPGAGADLVDGLFSQVPQRHRQEMCRIQMLGARQLHEILGHAQAVMDLPAQFIEELILPRAVAAAALLYQQQDGGERIAQVVHHLPQRMAVAGRCLLDAGQIDQADQIAGAAGAQLRAG